MAKAESVSYFMRHRAFTVFKVVNNQPPTRVIIAVDVIPHADIWNPNVVRIGVGIRVMNLHDVNDASGKRGRAP